jgi:hypothetical protein
MLHDGTSLVIILRMCSLQRYIVVSAEIKCWIAERFAICGGLPLSGIFIFAYSQGDSRYLFAEVAQTLADSWNRGAVLPRELLKKILQVAATAAHALVWAATFFFCAVEVRRRTSQKNDCGIQPSKLFGCDGTYTESVKIVALTI